MPPTEITVFECRIRAGFESPATDFVQKRINLNKELIQHEEATYGFKVEGDSMEGIGIFEGDRVLVDKAIIPAHNHIVIASIDHGKFCIKRLCLRPVSLVSENPKYPPIVLRDGQELLIWGVATFGLRKLT